MKKYSAGFVIFQIAFMVLTSWIVGLIIATSSEIEPVLPCSFAFSLFPALIWLMIYFPLINLILLPIAKHTYKKNAEEAGFDDDYTYVNKDTGTVGAIIKVDVRSGRLAYVSFQNPFKFQVVPVKEITHLKSDLIRGPLGGTRYVYFQFSHKNKKFMFPTFTSRNAFAIGSTTIQNALEKGNRICAMIMMARQASSGQQAQQFYQPQPDEQ